MDLFDHIKEWGGTSSGMTHNNNYFSGDESTDNIILNYWQTEFESWDIDNYSYYFNLYYTYYPADSTAAHDYAEEQAGFSMDDLNN